LPRGGGERPRSLSGGRERRRSVTAGTRDGEEISPSYQSLPPREENGGASRGHDLLCSGSAGLKMDDQVAQASQAVSKDVVGKKKIRPFGGGKAAFPPSAAEEAGQGGGRRRPIVKRRGREPPRGDAARSIVKRRGREPWRGEEGRGGGKRAAEGGRDNIN
jgi:hypothetical protein